MFSTLLTVTTLLTSLFTATANAYANPLACSGTCTNAHDPALIRRDDGTYFRFSTGNRIAIHTAPGIQGPWTYVGAALPQGSKINLAGNQDLWAPDVLKVANTYYMYYSVSSFGTQNSAIGVATSRDLRTWTDLGSTGVQSRGGDVYNAIDGNVAWDGTRFVMNYGSFWGDLFQVGMSNPPTKIVGSMSQAKQIAFVPKPPQAQEAAYTFQWGNFHYLFFSVGACCGYDANRPAPGAEYKIQVCRSSNIMGPYTDRNGVSCLQGGGTTVLESHNFVYGPGGQGVYMDPSMGPVLYYHYVDTRIGFADGQKRFGVNKINFSSGWPVV